MERDKMLDKARKILAVANGSNYEAEAQTALLQLQKLLLKEGLSMSDITEAQAKSAAPVNAIHEDLEEVGAVKVDWKGWLANILGRNFRCKPYWTTTHRTGKRVVTLRFIGLPQDVELAKQGYLSAVRFIDHLLALYIASRRAKGTLSNAAHTKQSFIAGFLGALDLKFKKQVEEQQWGLVLVIPEPVTKAVEAAELKKGAKSDAKYNGDMDAAILGMIAGADFDFSAGDLAAGDRGNVGVGDILRRGSDNFVVLGFSNDDGEARVAVEDQFGNKGHFVLADVLRGITSGEFKVTKVKEGQPV